MFAGAAYSTFIWCFSAILDSAFILRSNAHTSVVIPGYNAILFMSLIILDDENSGNFSLSHEEPCKLYEIKVHLYSRSNVRPGKNPAEAAGCGLQDSSAVLK